MISAILMLVMAYVGDRADWAIVVARELEVDFITAFQSIPLLLEQQIIDESSYWEMWFSCISSFWSGRCRRSSIC